ncbi:MAG: hypothetical protein GXO57_00705 [Thermodesulfobacteria bacterium]|nr:hypothetical protein [Thermodesulfobacteriota bacterium]
MLGTLQHTVGYLLEEDLGIKVVPNTFVEVDICKKFVAGGKFSYEKACFIKKAN